jgi:hypothetical protein
LLEVVTAAERIDQRAVAGPRHGIDGEVAPRQVLFERDTRIELHRESAVTRSALALCARQRVLLVRLRVQEHGKFPADLAVTEPCQFLRRRTDHDPITFADRPAEELVPNGAAYEIHLHRQILAEFEVRQLRLAALPGGAQRVGRVVS